MRPARAGTPGRTPAARGSTRERSGSNLAPCGRGKRKPERGRGSSGAAKQPRVESSSSERRDESMGSISRSGSARGRHDRGGYHTGRPRTPPHRPWPRGVSPRRSPRLQRMETVGDLSRLPIAAKPSSCGTAHSRSASEDERGQHPSRSSQSSS